MHRAAILWGLALLATAGAARSQPSPAPRVPSADDVLSVRRASALAISPDGSRVAYTVRETNWDDNAYETEIWLVEVASRESRQLTNGKKSSTSPAWSPDGKRLAFLSDRDGKRQVYVIDLRGGEAEAVTKSEEGVEHFAWAPAGDRIAFLQQDPEPEAMKERNKRDGEYQIVDEDRRFSHLHVVTLGAHELRRLTEGEFVVGDFDWSPDGASIAFDHRRSASPADGETADVSIVSVADRRVRALVTQAGPDSRPRWSPDGTHIAFESAMSRPDSYYANPAIAVVDARGGVPAVVSSALDEEPGLVAWKADGLYVDALDRAWGRLYRIDPATGSVLRLGPDTPTLDTSFTLSRDATQVAFLRASATTVGEVAVAPTSTLEAKVLTSLSAQLDAFTLGTRDVISWRSRDGVTIEGVLHKPRDFTAGKRYPLLVVIHGGPTGVSRPTPLGSSSVYPIDRWLARGALVLEPNYRGSAGYGERFRGLNVRNLGVGDAWDVLSGIDHLAAAGLVDPARVGAMGWSQGGYISAFLATHHSDRFRAISVGAGISNWTTYYVSTDIPPFTRQYLKATPWDDPQVYAATSPMTAITRAKTPTLIQHGENDRRVPISNAYELHQGLSDLGVPVRLIVYKGFGHGLNKPRAARAAMAHNEEWFDRYFFDVPPASGGAPGAPR